MPKPYEELLEATIQHVEDLRNRGVKHVAVTAELLAAVTQPPPRRVPARPPAVPGVAAATPASRARGPAAMQPLGGSPAEPAKPPPLAPPQPRIPDGPSLRAPIPVGGALPAPSATLFPVGRALTREEKEASMRNLRAQVAACQKCPHLVSSRRNVVFGVGDIHSPLMFVGEAPGADEDLQGEPFVGAAGQLLTKIIQAMGLGRGSVYIANILKCRPDTPGQSAGNRKPTPSEMVTCLPHLLEQIAVIQPKVIVALGATAVEGLLGKSEGITRLRGRWREFRGVPLMPTYHPAYLLRNQAVSVKREVWEDMLQVMERLGLPISQKQRGYFLKS